MHYDLQFLDDAESVIEEWHRTRRRWPARLPCSTAPARCALPPYGLGITHLAKR